MGNKTFLWFLTGPPDKNWDTNTEVGTWFTLQTIKPGGASENKWFLVQDTCLKEEE